MTAEEFVDRQIEEVLGLPKATWRQILIVRRATPRLGNWQDGNLAPKEGADIYLTGVASPSSDQTLKSAIIRPQSPARFAPHACLSLSRRLQ